MTGNAIYIVIFELPRYHNTEMLTYTMKDPNQQ